MQDTARSNQAAWCVFFTERRVLSVAARLSIADVLAWADMIQSRFKAWPGLRSEWSATELTTGLGGFVFIELPVIHWLNRDMGTFEWQDFVQKILRIIRICIDFYE